MARPKKDEGERKSETIAFRLTPAERVRLEHQAAKAGLTPSAYARMQTLAGKIVVSEHRTLAPDLFDELRRIGVNLNQLTRLAHIHEEPPPDLPRLCAQLDQFLIREITGYGAQGRS